MPHRLLFSSIDDVIARRAIPPEMLQDLLVIANLSHDTCAMIADTLRSLEGLISSDAIETAISNCLQGDDTVAAQSVFHALINLEARSIPKILSALDEWVAADERRREIFTASVLNQLRENLDTLVSDYPAVELMKKADQLLRDVGNEFQGIKFVCDLRPVLDKLRNNVEAFVLVANMRLIYLSQDGNRHTCEIALTEEELKEVHDSAKQAIEKMRVLNDLRSTITVGSGQRGDIGE